MVWCEKNVEITAKKKELCIREMLKERAKMRKYGHQGNLQKEGNCTENYQQNYYLQNLICSKIVELSFLHYI